MIFGEANGSDSLPIRGPFVRSLVLIALIALALHAGNLLMIAHHLDCQLDFSVCSEGTSALLSPDSESYLAVSRDITSHGLTGASYLLRSPGYPLLLLFASRFSTSMMGALWLVPFFASCAAAAIAWIAGTLCRSTAASWAAGVLFCVWPACYQFEAVIMTDAIHGMIIPVAFAFSLAWLRSEKKRWAVIAVMIWLMAQAIRPTFFVLPALWPILFFKPGASSMFRKTWLVTWALICIIPILIIGSNRVHHGITIATAIGPETLSAYAVPRLQEQLGMGDFRTLREQAWAHYRPLDTTTRIKLQREESWAFFRTYPFRTGLSFAKGIAGQLVAMPHYWSSTELAALYPPVEKLPRVFMLLFWTLAGIGLLPIARQQPEVFFFLIALFALIMLPASTSHWVEGRLRFPLDLLFMPCIIVSISEVIRRSRRL